MAALVGAAACSPGLAPATDAAELAAQDVTATEAGAAATAPTEATAASTAQAVASAAAAETAALTPTGVAVKQWLVATDPTTVSLAAGRPQLVKVFAFW
jgi:hypothetical protein